MKNALQKNQYLFLIAIAFTCISINSYSQSMVKPHFRWGTDQKKQYLKYREDPAKWSKKNLKTDLEDLEMEGKPMIDGVFPVPEYDLAGKNSFAGNGTKGNYAGIQVKNKKVIYQGFYVNRSSINREFIRTKTDEVYFTIVVLTDSIAKDGFSHMEAGVSSRNHPDYIGQGTIATKNNRIDFLSFITADRINYAVVNLRVFDLSLGRTILIAPQKDGSLRSIQVKTPMLQSTELEAYIQNLLKKPQTMLFFTTEGNI